MKSFVTTRELEGFRSPKLAQIAAELDVSDLGEVIFVILYRRSRWVLVVTINRDYEMYVYTTYVKLIDEKVCLQLDSCILFFHLLLLCAFQLI